MQYRYKNPVYEKKMLELFLIHLEKQDVLQSFHKRYLKFFQFFTAYKITECSQHFSSNG